MPELPEVETVRRQLAPIVQSAKVLSVEVEDARALKRHGGLPEEKVQDFVRQMTGVTLKTPVRRGKFTWIPFEESARSDESAPRALLAHLGMSGQILARTEDAPDDKHVRARLWLESPAAGLVRLDFADQRRFGSLAVDDLAPTKDGAAAGYGTAAALLPMQAAHIARDTLDPAFDRKAWAEVMKQRKTGVKKLLLDQTLMSGVGNIYADEALWQVQIHPDTTASRISRAKLQELFDALYATFELALEWGGTSFDTQYVNVNGESGYFAQSLEAYGRQGKPCKRCGSTIKQTPFMGRNSHFCPRCQPRR